MLAKTLAAGGSEAESRTAISRAYYAAYHGAKARLPDAARAGAHARDESHAVVWQYFGIRPESVCRAIAHHGRALKQRRQEADYEANRAVSSDNAREALAKAETILRQLEVLDREREA